MDGKKAYILSKSYTKKSLIGLGALKGSPCRVKKIEKKDGQTTVTLEWIGSDGVTKQESKFKINDGTPIYNYAPGDTYKYGDLVIYEGMFYRCTSKHTAGTSLDQSCFDAIGSQDGNFSLIDRISQRPVSLTPADRKAYLCIETKIFSVWDGYKWIELFKTDDELDEESENSLQNKVVTAEFKKKQDKLYLKDESGIDLETVINSEDNSKKTYISIKDITSEELEEMWRKEI